MSAFICNPEHIGLIAAWATKVDSVIYSLVGDTKKDTAIRVAEILARENIASVAYRYPNDKEGERPGPMCDTDEDIVKEACFWAEKYLEEGIPLDVAPLTIAKLTACLQYQSCEHPEWEQSAARNQANYINEHILRTLPGYARAPWEWYGETEKRF